MNFNRLARHYHWMERLFAGGLMQRCRVAFLARTADCRRALLVGEGTGRFLAELLRANTAVQIVCLEKSPGMIAQMRRRLAAQKLDPARVEFRQLDALDWRASAGKFDLLATHFFLDCFRPEELQRLVPRLAASAAPGAIWLLADFCIPAQGWRRWRARFILKLLYVFFRITTALSASWLTPPDALFRDNGFSLKERRRMNFGLAHADWWQKEPS